MNDNLLPQDSVTPDSLPSGMLRDTALAPMKPTKKSGREAEVAPEMQALFIY
jgi:hypothetical protein